MAKPGYQFVVKPGLYENASLSEGRVRTHRPANIVLCEGCGRMPSDCLCDDDSEQESGLSALEWEIAKQQNRVVRNDR